MRIEPISGSKFLAKMLKGYGVTTVFWVPSVLRSTLLEIEKLGIKKVVCHSEKAAAYMADGYARATKRPGVAIAQSVGAANMAAGLQDAYLGQSPVIALTGRWPAVLRDKHAYQEIDHWPLYEPVTKFNSYVDSVDELPFYIRQAFREATSGAPGPVHLDLLGLDGSSAVDQEGNLEFYIEEEYKYDVSGFSAGFGIGHKWLFNNKFTLSINGEIARNLGNFDTDYLDNIEGRFGVNFGYRF